MHTIQSVKAPSEYPPDGNLPRHTLLESDPNAAARRLQEDDEEEEEEVEVVKTPQRGLTVTRCIGQQGDLILMLFTNMDQNPSTVTKYYDKNKCLS